MNVISIEGDVLANTLPALKKLHGKTIVIKYGGNAMTETRLKECFAQDVLWLQLAGIQPVIIHGGGPHIEQALRKIGKQSHFIQGMRVTDEETMRVVEWTLAGEVQQDIVRLINYHGGRAVGLTGKDGALIMARKMQIPDEANPPHLIDIGYVGDVDAVDPRILYTLQKHGFIPVISPIATDEQAQTYNINADVVAGNIAKVLQAEKLIMMTNISGIHNKQGQYLADLCAQDIHQMVADGTISAGMLPKVSAALKAAKSGVRSVQIMDGRNAHALLHGVLITPVTGTTISA